MGPRKRSKPNTAAPAGGLTSSTATPTIPSQSTGASHASTTSAPTPASASKSGTPRTSQPPSQLSSQKADNSTDMDPSSRGSTRQTSSDLTPSKDEEPTASQARKTRSWYGSWPRVPKSSASTQIAGETIHGRTLRSGKTADFSKYETKKTGDAASVYSTSPSTTTLPNINETVTNNGDGVEEGNRDAIAQPGQSDGQSDTPKPTEDAQGVRVDEAKDQLVTEDVVMAETGADAAAEAPSAELEEPAAAQTAPQPAASYGWIDPLGWWGRSTAEVKPDDPKSGNTIDEPTEPPKEMDVDPPSETTAEAPIAAESTEPPSEEPAQAQQTTAPRSSWFGLWSSSTEAPASAPQSSGPPAEQSAEPDKPAETIKAPEDVVMQDAPPAEESAKEPAKPTALKAGSTWAFWSRDTGSKSQGKEAVQKQDSDEEEGQLAVIGESSENKPQLQKTKSIDIKRGPPKEPPVQSPGEDDDTPSRSSWLGTSPAKGSIKSKKSKRLRPQSMEVDEDSLLSQPGTPKSEPTNKVEPPAAKAGASKATTPATTTKPAQTQSNLLLPTFGSTYHQKENPSIIQQITKLLLRNQQSPPSHVYLAKEPPKINKALAIGVHGLFPASYLKPIIGQPTGTSIKFANHAANSIRRWADSHGCSDCEIDKVALEGEGKIGERVENLWKLLLNWIDTIRAADLIILACHSQGVPVTLMLLAKLIELGVITHARVGVCAMAGVSLGPFPDYRSGMGILMGSAAELWEFSNPASEISRRLEASVKAVLDHGARITFVGSIDDQLVPMESAIYSPAHHPYIYRSVFIDRRIHAPDFIAHLVGFALKLRNLGVTDHGLIRELSLPLAGSLYSGEGHSRLYDDEQVYDLALSHTLETTNLPSPPPCEMHHKVEGLTQSNPYHLPWIMRGLLEEDFVKTELTAETAELLRQFDDWKPITKALKDVKYRLEVLRSKL